MNDKKNIAISLHGITIQTGKASGIVVHLDSKTKISWSEINSDHILVIDYPGGSFLRYLYRAAAIIAEKGSKGIEMAGFLKRYGKPSIFSVSNARYRIIEGAAIDLDVHDKGADIIIKKK